MFTRFACDALGMLSSKVIRRLAVYEAAGRQFVIDDRGKRVYGVWWLPFDLVEELADVPSVAYSLPAN